VFVDREYTVPGPPIVPVSDAFVLTVSLAAEEIAYELTPSHRFETTT
jgi:hypothetical protein